MKCYESCCDIKMFLSVNKRFAYTKLESRRETEQTEMNASSKANEIY